MVSGFTRDLDDPDQPIFDALSERPGKPLRLRVQPAIWRARPGREPQYNSWRQTIWTLECDSADEALAVRDAMRTFFTTMGQCGPPAVLAALTALLPPEPSA